MYSPDSPAFVVSYDTIYQICRNYMDFLALLAEGRVEHVDKAQEVLKKLEKALLENKKYQAVGWQKQMVDYMGEDKAQAYFNLSKAALKMVFEYKAGEKIHEKMPRHEIVKITKDTGLAVAAVIKAVYALEDELIG